MGRQSHFIFPSTEKNRIFFVLYPLYSGQTAGSKIIGIVTVNTDITEKREMADRLLNQELSKQKLGARAMVDAQEKERAEIGKELAR